MTSDETVTGPVDLRTARRIRERRQAKELTQEQLGARCTVLGRAMTRDVVSKIEKGQRRVTPGDLVVFALALSTSVDYFLMPTVDDPQLTEHVKVPGDDIPDRTWPDFVPATVAREIGKRRFDMWSRDGIPLITWTTPQPSLGRVLAENDHLEGA